MQIGAARHGLGTTTRHVLLAMLLSIPWAWPQSKDIPPPANVIHDGIPPIPASLNAETDPYRTVPGSSLIGWDPEKAQMIVSGWVYGIKGASRVDGPGQAAVAFLRLPDWYQDAVYDPNGKFIIYVKPIDENFQDQIYRCDISTKATVLLTDGKSKNKYPAFSHSGKLLAYSSNRRDGQDMDIYVMNPLDPSSTRMLAKVEGEDWAVFAWSPDDTKVILSDWRSTGETYLWVFDLPSGDRTLLTPPTRENSFNGSWAYFGKDGKGVFIASDRGSEFRRLAYLDIATKHCRFLSDYLDWDIEEFALSPDGKMLAFVSNEDGIGRLRLMDTSTYKEVPVPELPAGVVSGLQWHRSLPYLGFEFSSTKSPKDVYSLNVQTGKIERWTTARNPVSTEKFREPELIKWKSFDGRTISGYLYRPPETFHGKRPVIISIHGGPTSQFRPVYLADDNYYINVLGIARIYPNARGSTGYGKTFMKLDDGPLRINVAKDVGALLDWIAKDPNLDSARVMVQGGSSGGYCALSVAEMYPTRVSALSSYSALTDLVTFVQRSSQNDQNGWRKEFGDERDSKTVALLEKQAPVNGAEKLARPAFIAIGGKDLMTSVPETERIVAILKEKGIPVWYLLAKNESHTLRDGWIYQYKFNAEVLFVKKYLIGNED